MGFESPGSLAWAGLAAVVAALYLWRFAARRQEVATLPLWQRALARRPAWFALRFWLSFAAQIAILLLLVLALARPYWISEAASRRWLVLVLDVSASMSAGSGQPTRWEQMKAHARQIIGDLAPGERMAIVSAGTLVRPLCRLGDERASLLAACENVAPTDGVSRIAEAVAMARRMLHGRPNSEIIVLSDGGFAEAAELRDADDVRLTLLGGPARNTGITRLGARPLASPPGGIRVLVEAANGGDQQARCTLGIETGRQAAGTAELTLEPGRSARVGQSLDATGAVALRAEIQPDDDLPADDRAFLPLEVSTPPAVHLLAAPSEVAAAIQNALDAPSAADLAAADEQAEPGAIRVYYRQVPAQLPLGPTLVLDPQTPCDLWKLTGTIDGAAAAVDPAAARHRLLSGVRLADAVFEQVARLEFTAPAQSIANTRSGEPIYSLLPRPGGPVLVFHAAIDRQYSDLVLRPDFQRLIGNAMDFLSGPATELASGKTTGEMLRLESGQSARRPARPGQPPPSAESGPLVPLDQAGKWEIAKAEPGGASRPLYVNLLDAAETSLVVPPELISEDLPVSERAHQPLWSLLAAAALLLLAVEFCLYHQRIMV